ncbi:protein-L-isoaspartate(D-aspartate) O-methyltransferase [Bacteroidota bacterium]
MEDSYRHKGLRKKLVDEIRRKGIINEDVIAAIEKIPRHLFMDSSFVNFAYKDQAFPIGSGQTISQPYTVAFQTSLLDLIPGHKTLEIGTGSGYQTAVLIEMGSKVFSIERQKDLFIKAGEIMNKLGYKPRLFYGDGYAGKPTYGPFDRILITAGATEVPKELLNQLKIGGKMVIPLGDQRNQVMTLIERKGTDEYTTNKHGNFIFVPLLKGLA